MGLKSKLISRQETSKFDFVVVLRVGVNFEVSQRDISFDFRPIVSLGKFLRI